MLPIDLMDRKVKLEAKGTFCGTRTTKLLSDGQNRSSEVSQRLKRRQILLGIFRMIKNKNNLQEVSSSFLLVAKGHALDVGLFNKSQVFHSQKQQRSAVESGNFPVRHNNISIWLFKFKRTVHNIVMESVYNY